MIPGSPSRPFTVADLQAPATSTLTLAAANIVASVLPDSFPVTEWDDDERKAVVEAAARIAIELHRSVCTQLLESMNNQFEASRGNLT